MGMAKTSGIVSFGLYRSTTQTAATIQLRQRRTPCRVTSSTKKTPALWTIWGASHVCSTFPPAYGRFIERNNSKTGAYHMVNITSLRPHTLMEDTLPRRSFRVFIRSAKFTIRYPRWACCRTASSVTLGFALTKTTIPMQQSNGR
jgi:hypothetical protein